MASTTGIKNEQRRQWERDKFVEDLVQPRDKEGANKNFIKTYRNEPSKLTNFAKSELRDAGVVEEGVADETEKLSENIGAPISKSNIKSRR